MRGTYLTIAVGLCRQFQKGKKLIVEQNFMELILFIDMIHSHFYPKPHDYREIAETPTNSLTASPFLENK